MQSLSQNRVHNGSHNSEGEPLEHDQEIVTKPHIIEQVFR